MDLSPGDEVVLDVEETTGSGTDSYAGPGRVVEVYPRGCLVETGVPGEDPWWVPRRFWGTRLTISGRTSS